MMVPYIFRFTITLDSGGGTEETGIVIPATLEERGVLVAWEVESSLAVVEPEIRIYTRIGQTTSTDYLVPGSSFTPNPSGSPARASGFFTQPIPFLNEDVRALGGKTTGTHGLYAVCANAVTTVMKVAIAGYLYMPRGS